MAGCALLSFEAPALGNLPDPLRARLRALGYTGVEVEETEELQR